MPGGAGPFQNAPDARYERRGQAALRTQDQVNALELTIQGQDKQFGAAGQFKTYDYPNPLPQPPKRYLVAAIRSQDWVRVDQLTLALKGKDTFFGAPGMGPDYDWPNPRGYVPAISLRTHLDPVKLLLIGKDAFFGAPGETKTYDWLNPDRYRAARYIVPANAQTWVTTPPIFLLLQPSVNTSKFTGKGALSPPSTAAASSKFLGYAVLEPAPFNFSRTSDWGWNPKGYLYPVSLRTWTDPLKLNLIGQDALPFGEDDWPNPRGPIGAADLRTWTQPGLASGLLAAPFWQADWPNPVGPRSLRQDGTATVALALAASPPFAQFDWPAPRGATRAHRDWSASLNVALNLFGDVPFRQTEWPNPKGYRRGDATLTVQPPLSLGFLAAAKFLGYGAFSAPDDAAAAAKFLGLAGLSPPNDAASLAKLLGYAVLADLPTRLLDWPNPSGPRYPADLRTWTNPARLVFLPALYFDAFTLMRDSDADAAGRISGAPLDAAGPMSGTLDRFVLL